MTSVEPMTNNNWREEYRKRFGLCDGSLKNCQCKAEIRFIEKNFIPLSSLKKFIEENKKEVYGCDEDPDPQAPGYHTKDCDMRPYGFNSALKLLKDKFIHE